MEELTDFETQSFKLKDLPASILFLINETIINSVVWSGFKALMDYKGGDDLKWLMRLYIEKNMTLHDLIGNMKRSGDDGSTRTYMLTVVMDLVRQSQLYLTEKRLRTLEAHINSCPR